MEIENDLNQTPESSDFHGNKRELIKRGVQRGRLTWKEIYQALPPEHLSETELEVLLFTFKSLKIAVPERPAS